jgi:hypothetical protein
MINILINILYSIKIPYYLETTVSMLIMNLKIKLLINSHNVIIYVHDTCKNLHKLIFLIYLTRTIPINHEFIWNKIFIIQKTNILYLISLKYSLIINTENI